MKKLSNNEAGLKKKALLIKKRVFLVNGVSCQKFCLSVNIRF